MKIEILKNVVKHFNLVAKHKYWVFKLSLKVGIPFRGIVHDLSKYSIIEFSESVKYYNGKISPLTVSREKNGYSNAWLHHKGRNRHHSEYWVDFKSPDIAPVIPYKYILEMVCDKLAASIVYNGKNWTNSSEYEYWQNAKKKEIINPKVVNFLDNVFSQVKENGIDKTLTKDNMKFLYKKYCIDDKTKYVFEFHGEWKEKLEK